MTPRFSIIIPTYNYASTLPRAVTSVLQQNGEDYEIIIINDGSTDNTAEIITQLQQQSPEVIRDFSQPNAGTATARNHGIKESRGQYLLFLDADDALMPNALAILRNVLNARDNAQVIVGAYIKVDRDGKEKYCGNSALSSNPEKRFADYLDKKLSLSNGATLFVRSIFDKLKFPEQFRSTEDVPVFAQALALFNTVGIEEPLVKIYRNPASLRYDADSALAIGLSLVDAVFNPAILPAPFMKYKEAFLVRRCLSLFRTLAAAGYKKQAKAYYHLAVQEDWRVLLKMEYWRKYLGVLV